MPCSPLGCGPQSAVARTKRRSPGGHQRSVPDLTEDRQPWATRKASHLSKACVLPTDAKALLTMPTAFKPHEHRSSRGPVHSAPPWGQIASSTPTCCGSRKYVLTGKGESSAMSTCALRVLRYSCEVRSEQPSGSEGQCEAARVLLCAALCFPVWGGRVTAPLSCNTRRPRWGKTTVTLLCVHLWEHRVSLFPHMALNQDQTKIFRGLKSPKRLLSPYLIQQKHYYSPKLGINKFNKF